MTMTRIVCLAMMLVVVVVVVLGLESSLASKTTAAAPSSLLSPESLQRFTKLVNELRGDDVRLVRWDATEHTVDQQDAQCEANVLSESVDAVVAAAAAHTATTADPTALGVVTATAVAAMEVLILCITDHPFHRATFLHADGEEDEDDEARSEAFYKAVVEMLRTSPQSPAAAASAAHLIWIASFASADHHDSFFQAGAVPPLAKIVLDGSAAPVAAMWAGAALQNLAANYCTDASRDHGDEEEDEESDGPLTTCWYEWDYDESETDHVLLSHDSGRMVVDAAPVREEMLDVPGLLDRLTDLVCFDGGDSGPGGAHAVRDRDERNPTIVRWTAAGTIKNLALQPRTKRLLPPRATLCLCRMARSGHGDWLEQAKAQDALHFLRRADPCWFDGEGDEGVRSADVPLCVDHLFVDGEGHTCSEYSTEHMSEEDCQTPDRTDPTLVAAKQCCGCGGGLRDGGSHHHSNVQSEEL
jgi:hypothetical protein